MKKIPIIRAVAAFSILAASILALLGSLYTEIPYVYVDSTGGAADLRDVDFSSFVAHPIEWEIFRDKILYPSEISPHAVYENPAYAKYLTIRTRMVVPDGNYIIFGQSSDYASRIFINGEQAAAFGHIDPNDENNNKYQVSMFNLAVQPVDGMIEVVFHIAGIIRDSIGYYGFYIGEHSIVSDILFRQTAYRLITLSILITCALFFFGYYFFIPNIKTNLWFGFIALVTALIMSLHWKTAFSLFPSLNYQFEYYGRIVSLLLLCAFYALYARSLFNIPKAVTVAIWTSSVFFSIVIFIVPIRVSAQYLVQHMVFIFAAMAVCIVCIIIRIKHYKPEHVISFIGQVIFILCGAITIFRIQRLITGFRDFTTEGMLIFIFAQMAALYMANNRAVKNESRLLLENAMLEQRNKLKEEFLQNISHELKTPLTIMSSHSQLARRHAESSENTDEYTMKKMKLVSAEAERAALMVSQLSEFVLNDSLEVAYRFARTDILPIILEMTDVYYPVLNKNNNMLCLALPDALPEVWIDGDRIIQVLVNLISNAVKFTVNGTITLGVLLTENRDEIEVYVEDTGRGMNENEISIAYERFYTNGSESYSGTGLGLHISAEIIKAHGTEIRIKSSPEKGTRVYFRLKALANGGDGFETNDFAD